MGGLLLMACLTAGCATTALTQREFNRRAESLAAGLTPTEIRALFGEPREIHPAHPDDSTPETWIYSRPKYLGRETRLMGSVEVAAGGTGRSASLPDYREVDVHGILELHLHWRAGHLESWQQIIRRGRSASF